MMIKKHLTGKINKINRSAKVKYLNQNFSSAYCKSVALDLQKGANSKQSSQHQNENQIEGQDIQGVVTLLI